MHTLAHYGFVVSSGCVGVSALVLLLFLIAALDTPRRELRNCVWQFPAVFAGLGLFWAAVAFGLSRV